MRKQLWRHPSEGPLLREGAEGGEGTQEGMAPEEGIPS